MPLPARRSALIAFAVIALFGLSGCLTVEEAGENSTTFRNSPLIPLISGGVGLFIVGVGIKWGFEAIVRMLPQRGRRRRSSWQMGEISVDSVGTFFLGLGVIVAGIGVLAVWTPSAHLAYVTVAEDRVIMRDDFFWFSETPKEYSFATMATPTFDKEVHVKRRGVSIVNYMTIGGERIQMAMVHTAAKEKLLAAHAAYQAKALVARNQNAVPPAAPWVAGNDVPVGQNPPVAMNFPPQPIQPVGPQPGQQPAGADPAAGGQALTIEEIPDGAPGAILKPQSPVAVGEKLQGQFGSRWQPVTVLQVTADGKVKIHWDGEPDGFDRFIDRSKLRYPLPRTPEELAEDERRTAFWQRSAQAQSDVQQRHQQAVAEMQQRSQERALSSNAQVGDPVKADSKFKRGDKLMAFWGNSWGPVTVLQPSNAGNVRIHWDGWSDSWDESISRDKLRFRK